MKYGILISALILCACANTTYMPDGLDLTNLSTFAVLTADPDTNQGPSDSTSGVLTINEIDGMSLSGLRYRDGYPRTVFVKPGTHQVYVQYHQIYGTAGRCMEVDAVGGEWYVVRKRAVGYSVVFWIENGANGEVIGNPCGMRTTPLKRPSESKALGA